MKAVRVHEYGGPDVLSYEEAPISRPNPRQVLVEVRAAGVNYADVTGRTGRYRPDLPWIPGNEGSGVICDLGKDVHEFAVGDRVAWATEPAGLPLGNAGEPPWPLASGSYAEYALVPPSRLVPIPDGVGLEAAASVMLQGITAHYLAFATYPVQPGDRVLVHAGAGGVGLLLTQFAKFRGATVYTTVSTKEKALVSQDAGADHVILYDDEDFANVVLDLTDGAGVSAVFDSVGLRTFDKSLQCLAPRGYLILYGQSSGAVAPLDLQRLHTNSCFVTRPSFLHYTRTRKELVSRATAVFESLAAETLKPRIYARYPIKQAADAHRELEARRVVGKLLLIP